jgi:hypothetical protein
MAILTTVGPGSEHPLVRLSYALSTHLLGGSPLAGARYAGDHVDCYEDGTGRAYTPMP